MILRAENLTVEVAGKRVVEGLNLTLSPGQSWAVLGRNGVGKSTLIHTLAGLRKPQAGRLWLGEELMENLSRRQIAQSLGVLFQQEATPFPATVLETVLSGRFPHLSQWQQEGWADYERVESALALVELSGLEQRRSDTLSGGERRRQDLAVLLVQDPTLFLLDEPVNHLDLHYQIHLLSQLRSLTRRSHKTLFMALHEMNLVSHFCDHCLLLYGSGRHEQGAVEAVIDAQRLSELFGHPVRLLCQGQHRYWLPDYENFVGTEAE
ncbi:MAG: ABC transporter ATP-binding protein [Magnetococcales bacterium]|nr:ABC transporter ATP-binding protein [Magnetococcales bacterium]